MHYIPYNSRKGYHKTPFGAVAAGAEVLFRIILPNDMNAVRAWLVMYSEATGERFHLPMIWERSQGSSEAWWRVEYTPGKEGLYFYHFEFETPAGRRGIYDAGSSLGKFADTGGHWQLTVYNPSFSTPEWVKGGVIYQIFPDRFYSSGTEKQAVPVDRILRADWGGEPLWEPDEHGSINEYDYFGGDLNGITQKLPELKALGVTCIYLNPIFEAHSNHRYDTADYLKIDPLLGDENDFALLCERALENGIRVVLDGVFSHTGADSRYFNKNRRYPPDGAYNSKKSPYYPWYKFNHWPDDYKSWWGIEILPEINEEDPAFIEFIAGENGVARKWLNAGASGWRLDVADELPDRFLEAFRKAVKSEKPDVYILGEVWEDASNKSSYGCRRRYLHGHQLDSVMNYPFSSALIEFMQSGSAEVLEQRLLGILENYPPPAIHTLMNHIGTHDTVRVLTLLAGAAPVDTGKHARAREKLNAGQMTKGIALMKLITALQFTLPGVPCVYYGDEAGMQGGQDPFNRGCYPWGNENRELLAHYKALGEIRKVCPALADGNYETVTAAGGLFAFERSGRGNRVLTVVNRGVRETDFVLDNKWLGATVLLGKEPICGNHIKISVNEAVILTV